VAGPIHSRLKHIEDVVELLVDCYFFIHINFPGTFKKKF
jgi:hypothetical protein